VWAGNGVVKSNRQKCRLSKAQSVKLRYVREGQYVKGQYVRKAQYVNSVRQQGRYIKKGQYFSNGRLNQKATTGFGIK
jgi:hypothetical protein